MNPAYAAQDAKSPKEPSFNDRLNRLHESMAYQCERIESVLGRVNGTPPTPIKSDAITGQNNRPTLPLAALVDNFEQMNQRLSSLASGVEKIA